MDAVVAFADQNWNCADVACDQTVPAGSGQPDYACAEVKRKDNNNNNIYF